MPCWWPRTFPSQPPPRFTARPPGDSGPPQLLWWDWSAWSIGGLALARPASRFGTASGRLGAIAALVAGLIAVVNGGLNLAVANGGPGTGNGVVGGAAAFVLGLIALALGGLALARCCRTALRAGENDVSSTSATSNPAASFEPYRRRLLGLAYRMLGSMADAEEAVQETYLRWHAADRDRVSDPRAFLMTTTTRICLDMLTSARARREEYLDPWLPEPVVDTAALAPDNARNWLRICPSRCS